MTKHWILLHTVHSLHRKKCFSIRFHNICLQGELLSGTPTALWVIQEPYHFLEWKGCCYQWWTRGYWLQKHTEESSVYIIVYIFYIIILCFNLSKISAFSFSIFHIVKSSVKCGAVWIHFLTSCLSSKSIQTSGLWIGKGRKLVNHDVLFVLIAVWVGFFVLFDVTTKESQMSICYIRENT